MQDPGTPAYVLSLPRREHDAALSTLWSDPRVMRHLGGVGPATRAVDRLAEVRAHWRDHGFGLWTIEIEASPVGLVGLERSTRPGYVAELTYLLSPARQGRGVMGSATAKALGDFRLRVGLEPVCAVTRATNTSSRRLLVRLGFVHIEDAVEYSAVQCLYASG